MIRYVDLLKIRAEQPKESEPMRLESYVHPYPYKYAHTGWGCGYVALPPEHPYFGKHPSDIKGIHVQGGITFSHSNDDIEHDVMPNSFDGCWVLGFDTSDFDCDRKFVEEETERFRLQLEAVWEHDNS